MPLLCAWYLGHWVLGILRYEAGDLVEARRELERGFAAAARFGAARQSLGTLVSYLAHARQATGSSEAPSRRCWRSRKRRAQRV